MLPEPGTLLGIYRLTQRIGAGGMGEVWKAEDTRLHRNVAIKLLPAAMTGDEESRARLLREARTAGQLYHPNIATIHAIELDGAMPYMVMEYVEGESLTRAIGSRRLTEAQIAEMGRGIADALAEAHAKGIVHRDIKPDNVILSGNRVKVLDFGIAKRYGDAAQAPAGEIVTEAGVVLGTVNYMSPEQAMGKTLDGRSDIFSLGVMLYQALAGQMPFRGNSNLETLKQILRSEPRELTSIAPAVSPEMARIVARCLRKATEERYQSADELARDLAQIAALGMMRTPPSPVPLPSQPAAHSDSITIIQPIAAAREPAPAIGVKKPTLPGLTMPNESETGPMVGAKKPTLPGLTMPEVTVPAVTRPSPAMAPTAPAHSALSVTPNATSTAQQIAIAAPEPPRSLAPWIIAGASFVIVLAIAGGFVIAKLFGTNESASRGKASVAASAEPSKATTPAVAPVAPAAQPSAATPAASPATSQATAPIPAASRQPARAASSTPPVAASATVAAPPQDYAAPRETKDPFRAAMDSLEGSGWHYVDDHGAITEGADAAEPLFRAALDDEPGHASAQLHLAVTALFRRRYDVAKRALLPLLTNDTLSFEERTIASFAYSASAVAPSGNGVKEFEASLDQSLAYYGSNPQFASFARDVRWLVKRKGRVAIGERR
ncbi:MAG: protein kinase [Thermoanaerobaculia bacterium]|jgi:serine/threonine-protein kinase